MVVTASRKSGDFAAFSRSDVVPVEPAGTTEPHRIARSAGAADLRPAGTCPLCTRSSGPLDVFGFTPRPDLPDEARFEFCAHCNFIFAGDVSAAAYRRYYASVRNDQDHVVNADEPDAHVRLQVDHIAAAVAPRFAGRLLDFGCGQGTLLHSVARRFPDASLYGHDVADFLPPQSGVRFVPSLVGLEIRFDLIVLSHVLEHLVDFEVLATLEGLLEPGGRLYVEVPNPLEYRDCPRREFMYYFDRLHINHFGARAMRGLLRRYGLDIVDRGTHRFRYRDGHYPAMYHVSRRWADGDADRESYEHLRAEESEESALDAVYGRYRQDEATRALGLRRRLELAGGSEGVLVYGAGDNFWRSLQPDGPLATLPLLAVMDRRAAEMRSERNVAYELPDVALSRFPAAPVVVTVSQQAEQIAGAIRADWPARPLFFA